MAELENQRTLLEIDLDVDALNSQAALAQAKVDELAASIKRLKEAEGDNAAQIIQLTGQMRSYQQVVTQAVNVNKQLTTSQNTAAGSIDEMRANLSVITRQYNSLSAAERENADIGGKLLTQQAQLAAQLKKLEEAGGNARRSVGSYEESIRNALNGMIPFSTQLSEAARLFNSLSVANTQQAAAQEAATVAQAEATATAEALAAANVQLTVAQEAVAASEAQVIALQQANTASATELAAAQELAAAAAAELAVAQELQAGASAEAATAQAGAAVATESAAAGFKLFDLVLKSTIIGAIIGLILLLINYLKTFDPLVDLIEQGIAALSAAFNFLGAALKNAILAFSNIGNVIKNIGDFFEHPIESIKSFGAAMAQAAIDAAKLKEAEQDLADAMKVSEVATADAAQKTAALILAARNRSLSVADRKKLLDEAAKVNQDDFDRRKALNDKEIQLAIENARINGQLSDDQLKKVRENGIAELIILQNGTEVRGKITDEDIDKLKKAELDRIAIRQETTQRAEKIQNRIDSDAEKAAAAEEKRQQKAAEQAKKDQKAADELAQSIERTRAFTEGKREAETAKINLDYDKRIAAARGYAKLISQLEAERLAALKKQRDDFAIEDAKQQNSNNTAIANGKIESLKRQYKDVADVTTQGDANQEALLLNNLAKQKEIQQQSDAENYAFQLAQKDLTAQQVAGIDEAYRQQELQRNYDFEQQRTDVMKDFSQRRAEQAQVERNAVETFEKGKRDAVSNTLGVVTSIFGKQSALGKAALIIQKLLAVAEIVIQTQKQVAAIELAAAYQSAQAALTIPFPFSIGVIAGIQVAAAAKAVLAEVTGAIQIATVVAQAVSGFAKGGIYTSDGKGGLLPGYSKHDNINAHLRSGEGIIVSEAMQNPVARAAVSAINVAHGGRSFGTPTQGNGFATGGVFGPGFSVTDDGATSRYIEQFAVRVAQNMPQQVLVLEDVNSKIDDANYIQTKQKI